MTDFIVSILAVTDDLYTDDRPSPAVLMTEYAGRRAYLYSGDSPAWPDSYIVGAWEDTGLQTGQTYDEGVVIGTPTYPLHSDYVTHIRPLGNDNGEATGLLDSLRWAGHPEAKYLQDDQRYPAADSPFTLQLERVLHPGGEPEYPVAGWGWTVTMLSDDPLRDITARAIGVYSDPEATLYEFTTGGFIDEGGEYLTRCPPGQVQPTDAQVNFALLLGSAQEGFFNIPEGEGTGEALFWSHDQGETAVTLWVQPAGGHDAYQIGDQVTHNGDTWESTHANNVWEPGVFGWVII